MLDYFMGKEKIEMPIRDIDYYMRLPYTAILGQERGRYTVAVEELPGCKASGSTQGEALEQLYEEQKRWITRALGAGEPIPLPSSPPPPESAAVLGEFFVMESGGAWQINDLYGFIRMLINKGFSVHIYDPDAATKNVTNPEETFGRVTDWWVGTVEGEPVAYFGTPESFAAHYVIAGVFPVGEETIQ